jgi:hypothetical protein
VKTISIDVLLKSDLITTEDSYELIERFVQHPQITSEEILELGIPAKNRVEALLQREFLNESTLRGLAFDFAAHTLHIFEEYAPGDYRPHECLSMAFLLNTWGIGSWDVLQKTIEEARPALWRLQRTKHMGAIEACHAALLVGSQDAARMAREVAVCAQTASHRAAWENRRSNFEPMNAREEEACWQLEQIVERM